MTGTRRSSRHHSVPEKDKPSHVEEQSDPRSQHEKDSNHGKDEKNTKKSKKEIIGGVRRNSLDDGAEFYHTKADKWIPGAETSSEPLKVWAEKQMLSSSRPSPDPEFEVNGVRRDLVNGLMVLYRQKGRNEAGLFHTYQWVPVGKASPKTISAWAKVEKERIEESVKLPEEHQISSRVAKRLLMLEDLLDGETIESTKPDWMSDSPSPDQDQDYNIPPHAPHYPLPVTFSGDCNNATQPSSVITHTNLVAACQASKHHPNGMSSNLSPHLVCTACHDNSPTQRLTQHEIDHIIRDKGIFPLCSFCTEAWCEHYDVDAEKDSDNCTCKIQLPQWLCADCCVEMARARSRRADGCDECSSMRTEREQKGEDVIGRGVHMCSGCQALVVKQT